MPSLQAALEVFVWAIGEAKTVFFLLFCVLGQSALLMLLLFQGEYPPDPTLGATADDYLNTIVAMFVVRRSVCVCVDSSTDCSWSAVFDLRRKLGPSGNAAHSRALC